MSDKIINTRQKLILLHCQIGISYSAGEISGLISQHNGVDISAATLRRDLSGLCENGFLTQSGSRKASKYQINLSKVILAPIDANQYCQIDIDSRPGSKQFNFEIFKSLPDSLFQSAELSVLQEATKRYELSSVGASSTARRKELERFIIELSWKSSKIEGNTYTLLDTELLIKEGIEASGHSRAEALMILNHKRAFDFVLQARSEFIKPRLPSIIDIHHLLVADLDIAFGLRSRLIGITGSIYKPLPVPTQIKEACDDLILALHSMQDPYSKALLALAGISYIQPFEDGNKRTSRLTANAILLATNCAPLSYRNISEINYREAVLTFYEKNTILPLKKLFVEQYLFACENYLKL